MRILLVGPMPPPVGGATVLFRQLAEELSATENVEVKVVSTARGQHWCSAPLQFCMVLARTILKLRGCDIVSLHCSSRGALLFGPLLFMITRIVGKPFVFRSFGNCSEWHRRLGPKARWIFERTVLKAEAVLMETQAAVSYFRPICERVHWYANSRPLVPQDSVCQIGPARRFVFIGHVKPTKGVREIIAAAEELSGDTTVDIYGPPMDGITAAEFEGKRAWYCGPIAPALVPKILSRYDVLLLPSYYAGEGYPGIILEAYAAGLPVIATRWLAIPEIVDETSGILVAPGNTQELADAMRRISTSPALLNRLRAGAREKAKRFSSAEWTRRFCDIAREAIQLHADPVPAEQSSHLARN